jgi:archaeal flagellar protein FlaF
MAVGGIIGSAIGIMLLIVIAYLLVGNVLTTAEVVTNAQKDLTILSEVRLHTDLRITNVTVSGMPVNAINLTVRNTGTEIISDFPHTDIFVYTVGGSGYSEYLFTATDTGLPYSWSRTIINDYVHPGELDPGESMYVNAYYPPGTVPYEAEICTNNGVYASTIL